MRSVGYCFAHGIKNVGNLLFSIFAWENGKQGSMTKKGTRDYFKFPDLRDGSTPSWAIPKERVGWYASMVEDSAAHNTEVVKHFLPVCASASYIVK